MRRSSARKKLSATDSRNLQKLLLLSVFEGKSIGERIAKARNEKGLRQEDLADLINVSTRTIQGYEAGETSQYRRLKQIGEVLGKPVEWLLHGDPEGVDEDVLSELLDAVEANQALLRQVLERLDALESERPPASAPFEDVQEPV